MTAAPSTRNTARRALVVVGLTALVAGAAALRFWALGHGLPLLRGRPDELEVIQGTTTFPTGDFNPRFFVYPNFYFYLVFGWIELLLVAQGWFHPVAEYARRLTEDVPSLILYGRSLSAAVGTASVLIAYAIGRRLSGRSVGLIAAALLAANFLHIRDSHALKPDIILGIAMLISLWLLGRHRERGDRRHEIQAGIAVGLTMAIKYNGIFLLLPAYIEDVRASTRSGWRRLWPSATLWRVIGVAAVTFLLACPYMWLDFGRTTFTSWFLAVTVFSTRPQAAATAGSWLYAPVHFVATRAFGYHWSVSLWHGFGAVATILLIPALVHAATRRHSPMRRMSVMFVVLYYLVISSAPVHLVRYFTALVPVLTMLLADFVGAVANRWHAAAARATVATAMVVALVAEPLASAIAHDRIASRPDTRVLAAEWIREHLPANGVAVVLGSNLFVYADPELPPTMRRVPTQTPVDQYTREGVTHVITHEHRIPFSRLDPAQIQALTPHLRLLKEFSPFEHGLAGGFEDEDAFYIPFYDFAGVVSPGPLVHIYAYEPGA